MKKLNNKGFTLVEVIAVVVILVIIGLIAVPNVLSVINTGNDSSYDILVENITVAGKQLYEEIDYIGNVLYHYDINGKTGDIIEIIDNLKESNSETQASLTTNLTKDEIIPTNMKGISLKVNKTIVVNLQTLVSNGFLTGSNNSDSNNENKNGKIVINPKTEEDIGDCVIAITRKVYQSGDGKYIIEAIEDSEPKCPTNVEYDLALGN